MDNTYFCVLYRMNDDERYLLWFDGDVDGVVIDSDGSVPSFENVDALQKYAKLRKLEIKVGTPRLHDLNKTATWIETGSAATIDCDNLLEAWNLFADISRSIAGDFDMDTEKTDALYMRLFYGGETANNVLRPKDEPIFRPRFSKTEARVIRETLDMGMAMFKRVVRPLCGHDHNAA